MNYLDAHKICSDYVGIISKGNSIYYPFSSLLSCGIQNKEMVETAMILFFAHSVLWNDMTETEMGQMKTALSFLDSFVEDSFAKEYERNFMIIHQGKQSATYRFLHKRQCNDATEYIKNHTSIQLYDDTRFVDAINHITAYKKTTYIPKMKTLLQEQEQGTISIQEYWKGFLNLVGDYSDEIYHYAKIPTTPSDYYFFVSFGLMQDWVDDENLGKFYHPYKEYIVTHVDSWN